jgi:hypothetical protein
MHSSEKKKKLKTSLKNGSCLFAAVKLALKGVQGVPKFQDSFRANLVLLRNT